MILCDHKHTAHNHHVLIYWNRRQTDLDVFRKLLNAALMSGLRSTASRNEELLLVAKVLEILQFRRITFGIDHEKVEGGGPGGHA